MRELPPLPADPEEMNDRRAQWAATALGTFMLVTGTDAGDALSDLLCDLMHLADRDGDIQAFKGALDRATRSYEEETSDG